MAAYACCFAGRRSIAAEPATNEVLRRTFTTALLLTGNVAQSEAAIADSFGYSQLLVQRALEVALAAPASATEQDVVSSLLPPELRRVLRLPTDLRQCFVLRILAGLPGAVCAPLLHKEISQVEEAAGAAAQMLAEFQR